MVTDNRMLGAKAFLVQAAPADMLKCKVKNDPFHYACSGKCPPDPVKSKESGGKNHGKRDTHTSKNNTDNTAKLCFSKA